VKDVIPYPIPLTNLPMNPAKMPGARITMINPAPMMRSPITVIHFLPIASANYPANSAPIAAPIAKKEIKNSRS